MRGAKKNTVYVSASGRYEAAGTKGDPVSTIQGAVDLLSGYAPNADGTGHSIIIQDSEVYEEQLFFSSPCTLRAASGA